MILVVNVKSFARNCAFFSPLETPYHDRKLFLSLFFPPFFWPVDWKKNLMPKSLVEKKVISANVEKAWEGAGCGKSMIML